MIQLEKVIGDNCKKWNHKEHIFEKVNGEYIGITYGDFLEQTRSLASYLLSRGLKKKSILIYGNNSCKYMMADLAVLHYVGISVCVSKEWKEAELKQAIELLDISCVLYGEDKRDVINEVAKDCAMTIYRWMRPLQKLEIVLMMCLSKQRMNHAVRLFFLVEPLQIQKQLCFQRKIYLQV